MVTEWSWGLKYSIGNIVNNIVTTMYGIDGYEIFWDDQLVSYIMSSHCGKYLKLI